MGSNIKRAWQELPLATQAAIRTGERRFRDFLGVATAAEAAQRIRDRCMVISRSNLDQDPVAGDRWLTIDAAYQAKVRADEVQAMAEAQPAGPEDVPPPDHNPYDDF